MSYDPSQWYSYSKNRPDSPKKEESFVKYIPSKIVDLDKQKAPEKSKTNGPIIEEKKSSPEEPSKVEAKLGLANPVVSLSDELPGINTEQLQNKRINDFVKRLQKMTREMPRYWLNPNFIFHMH